MTRINPPLPPRIQQATQGDTQQNVDRHHHDDPSEEKDFGEGFKDAYDDLTDVSIDALIAFLQGLIADKPATRQEPTPPPHNHTPNARAAMSYQSHAKPTPPQAPAQDAHNPSALDQVASQLDKNEVTGLIRELMQLSARGVRSLALEKSDSFLDSIRQALKNNQT